MAEALKNQGNLYIKKKKYQDAIECYKNALKCPKPSSLLTSTIYANLSLCALKGKDYPNVILYGTTALLDHHDMPKGTLSKVYYRRGLAYFESQEYEKSEIDLQQAQILSPTDGLISKKLKIVQESITITKRKAYEEARVDSAEKRIQSDIASHEVKSGKKKKRKKKKKSMKKEKEEIKEVGKALNVVKLKFTKAISMQHPIERKSPFLLLPGKQLEEKTLSVNLHQKRIIRTLMNQATDVPLAVGDHWHLIVYKWWTRWCTFVQYDEEGEDVDDVLAEKPMSINNKALLQVGYSSDDTDEVSPPLFPGLVEGNHFVLVPSEVWDAFMDWYGGGPALIRTAARVGGENSLIRIDLYPTAANNEPERESPTDDVRTKNSPTHCQACGHAAANRCTQCYAVSYCGRECQRAHWRFHQSVCKTSKANHVESRRGKVGLQNLGNTCFMNSAIQCLSHTTLLTKHFLSDAYKADINVDNVLGTQGGLANVYGDLLKDMWFGSPSFINPTRLKRAISHFAPQFSGYQQHDSQELIAYLMDGLHEDLNRVVEKPYVESKEANGRCDDKVADEAWCDHLKRNKSIFVDHVQGQFKSTVVCPACDRVSVTFDPFNCIPLEIPIQTPTRMIPVTFIPLVKVLSNTFPMHYVLEISKKDTVLDLVTSLSKLVNCNVGYMTVADVYDGKLFGLLESNLGIETIREDDNIVVYESDIPSEDDQKGVLVQVLHIGADKQNAEPYLLLVDKTTTQKKILEQLVLQMRHFLIVPCETQYDIGEVATELGNYVSHRDASGVLIPFEYSEKTIAEKCFYKAEWRLDLNINWKTELATLVHADLFLVHKRHSSVQSLLAPKATEGISLDACFEKFTRSELLDDDNVWYCSKCKDHQQATKTLNIWRVPDVVIISLKRFEYRNAIHRDKLDVFVDFPIDGLDMSKYSLSSGEDIPDRSLLYDLYAVDNHFGRMGFGHYTAFARDLSPSAVDQEWYNFDDSRVSRMSKEDVHSNAAYILFYRRRGS